MERDSSGQGTCNTLVPHEQRMMMGSNDDNEDRQGEGKRKVVCQAPQFSRNGAFHQQKSRLIGNVESKHNASSLCSDWG